MNMSRMQLHRKLKALTDHSPGEFIRVIRLRRAAALLKEKAGNIAEVAYDVGFTNPSYFSECFKKLYGKLPSEYAG
jgi:AraC-like DNA-binding protein